LRKRLIEIAHELNQEKFESDYEKFIEDLYSNENTKSFGKYLFETYSKNKHEWAYCYRKFIGINTNMHIENFHKQLKDRYFKRMSIDRMDKSVTLILQYIKDRSRERIVSLLRGKHTYKDASINSNHRLSEKLNISSVFDTNEINAWDVISSQDCRVLYSVRKISQKPCCGLLCSVCKVCIHQFVCDCKSCVIQGEMCKHIHLTCRKINVIKSSCDGKETGKCSMDFDSETLTRNEEIEAHIMQISKPKLSDIEVLKVNIIKSLNALISDCENSNSIEELNLIKNSIRPLPFAILAHRDKERSKRFKNIKHDNKYVFSKNRKIEPQRQKFKSIKKFKKMKTNAKYNSEGK
jgi:hypothetical protein